MPLPFCMEKLKRPSVQKSDTHSPISISLRISREEPKIEPGHSRFVSEQSNCRVNNAARLCISSCLNRPRHLIDPIGMEQELD